MAELNELRARIEYLEQQNISLIEYINQTSHRVNLVTDIVWSNKGMSAYLINKDSWSWLEYPDELIGPGCVVTERVGAKLGRFDGQGGVRTQKEQMELIKILKPFEESLSFKKSETIETGSCNNKTRNESMRGGYPPDGRCRGYPPDGRCRGDYGDEGDNYSYSQPLNQSPEQDAHRPSPDIDKSRNESMCGGYQSGDAPRRGYPPDGRCRGDYGDEGDKAAFKKKKKLAKKQKRQEIINNLDNSNCETPGVIDSIESPTNATHIPVATEIIPILTVPTAPPKPPRKKISC
tara:strand:- start:990 stop:1862 length:873 start_codon:yes stop_codon:yes gene_type:complete